jgi:hypothetical protein
MKYFFTLVFLLTLGAGCKQKVLSGTELENKLKETMKDYLHKTLQPGTEVTIKDISYYPVKEKKLYLCEFHVNMHTNNKDTTGLMAATISNDFKEVHRTQ